MHHTYGMFNFYTASTETEEECPIAVENRFRLKVEHEGVKIELKLSRDAAQKVVTLLAKQLGVKNVISDLLETIGE